MFKNIGEKIKKLAKVVCWIGIIGSVIAGIIMLLLTDERQFWDRKEELIISGIAWIVVGPLASWIGCFLLYGFGELISSQKQSERYLKQLCKNQSPNKGANADTVAFGTYPQTEEGTDNTPIEWEVLERDGDKALLISKYALDCIRYNTKDKSVTWETCSLRTWLNGDFYNKAFNAEEKRNIVLSKVTADKNPSYSTDPGKDTDDNVFLLSIPEVNNYLKDKASRMCAPTDYAVKNGAYTNNSDKVDGRASCWWWLRSPGDNCGDAASVSNDGFVHLDGYNVTYSDRSVRPCVWVRLF